MNSHDILVRGYFPKELPPPFTTEPLGTLVQHFPALVPALSKGPRETLPIRHSLPRAGALRRILSTPNPLSFLKLCQWFQNNWPTVISHCQKSFISLSSPSTSSTERAVIPAVPFNQQPTHQASLRAKSRYILKTDITNCYPSIYTHSISWALHTKIKAKTLRRPSQLIGNQLDRLISNAQHGQTIGIPIGPDTSFIVAEMLLSSVDEEFCDRMSHENLHVNGFRSFDDYEFGFTTRADAEKAVAILQQALAEFELQLNPGKTRVIELPVPLEPNWVSELRSFNFNSTPFTWDLRRYFDRAFDLSRTNRDSEVLKYAIQRLRSVDVPDSDFELFQDFLLQCSMVEPGALPAVVDHLHHYVDQGMPINAPKVEEVFNLILSSHAPLRHGSEVAWALWGSLLFGLRIDDVAASAVAGMEDAFAALLLLHAQDSGLTYANLPLRGWHTAMTTPGLRSNLWLLSYEANVKGWITTSNDHVLHDNQFGILKHNNVYFYDVNAMKSHSPSPHYNSQDVVDNLGGY